MLLDNFSYFIAKTDFSRNKDFQPEPVYFILFVEAEPYGTDAHKLSM